MTKNPEILTDGELYALEGEWEGMSGNDISAYINLKIREKLLGDLTQPIAPRLLATIRELKKDLKLADFLSDKLEEKIAGLEKENERLNNIIRVLMNPRMKHGTLQGPLTAE